MKNKISIVLILVIILNSMCLSIFAEEVSLNNISNGITASDLYDITYSNDLGLYVAVGADGVILTSPNKTTWTQQTSNTSLTLYGVTYGNSLFVAVGDGGIIRTSSNGIAWDSRTSGISVRLDSVVWNGNKFIAVGTGGSISVSIDGINWSSQSLGNFYEIAWGNSLFVAVGYNGIIKTSSNGTTWDSRTSGTSNSLISVTWNGSKFVAVGVGGTISTSTNGINWTTISSGLGTLRSITWDGTQFIVVGNIGILATSPDATTWTSQNGGVLDTLQSIKSLNNNYLIVGNGGYIGEISEVKTPTSITQENISLTELKTSNISTALVYDQNGELMNGGYTLTYSIANEDIATIDANGVITAKEYMEGNNTTTLTISTIENVALKKIINITIIDEIITPITEEELKVLLEGVNIKIDIVKDSYGTININNTLEVLKKMLEAQDSTTQNKLLDEVDKFLNAIGSNQIILDGKNNKTLHH